MMYSTTSYIQRVRGSSSVVVSNNSRRRSSAYVPSPAMMLLFCCLSLSFVATARGSITQEGFGYVAETDVSIL